MDRNFACFGPKFFGGEPPEFWKLDYKIGQFPIMWQSFTVIGRGISEITRWKQKKHHEHFISPFVTLYGRPNKLSSTVWFTFLVKTYKSPGLSYLQGRLYSDFRVK